MKEDKLFDTGVKAKHVLELPFLFAVLSPENPGWTECCDLSSGKESIKFYWPC